MRKKLDDAQFTPPAVVKAAKARARKEGGPAKLLVPPEAEPRDLAQLSVEDLLRVLGALITFDAGKLYREDGTPVALSELDLPTRQAIQALEVDENWEYDEDAEARINVGVTKKIRQYDRIRATQLYAELKGFAAQHTGKKDRLDEVIAAMKAGPVKRK